MGLFVGNFWELKKQEEGQKLVLNRPKTAKKVRKVSESYINIKKRPK